MNADNNSNSKEENSNNKLEENKDKDKDKEIEESKSMKKSPGKLARTASASSTKSSVGEQVDSFSGLDSGKKKENSSPFSIGVKGARFIKGSFEEGGNTFLEIDLLVTGLPRRNIFRHV